MLRKLFFGTVSIAVVLLFTFSPSFGAGRGGSGGGWGGGRGSDGSFSQGGGHFNQGGFNAANRSGFNAGNGFAGDRGAYGNYYYGNGWGGRGWGGGWGYWPWFAGWGLGWGYPYGYNYYYPDGDAYYYSYAPSSYADSGAIAGAAGSPPQAPGSVAATPNSSEDDQRAASEGLEYYSQARSAFLEGDYRHALRLAGHAAVESPQNPRVHELISLALFALGNFPAAASEAHAAMAMGPIPEWKDLYGYYNDINKYTAQLRALEKAATGNPKSAADHFLLGYHYLMTGARDDAKTEFAQAVNLTPKDKLASHYLKQLESNAPLTPPQIIASKPKEQSR